jgi:hypothetical protein
MDAQYDVGLRPGTDPNAYVGALGPKFGSSYGASTNQNGGGAAVAIALAGTLMLLLSIAAGLGVLNTVVLHTRERVHDLGVFKAVGMTPPQTVAMVLCSVAGTGLLAGVIAPPARCCRRGGRRSRERPPRYERSSGGSNGSNALYLHVGFLIGSPKRLSYARYVEAFA